MLRRSQAPPARPRRAAATKGTTGSASKSKSTAASKAKPKAKAKPKPKKTPSAKKKGAQKADEEVDEDEEGNEVELRSNTPPRDDAPTPPREDSPTPPRDDAPTPPCEDSPTPPRDDSPAPPPRDDSPTPPLPDDAPTPPPEDLPTPPPRDDAPTPSPEDSPTPPRDDSPSPPPRVNLPSPPPRDDSPTPPPPNEPPASPPTDDTPAAPPTNNTPVPPTATPLVPPNIDTPPTETTPPVPPTTTPPVPPNTNTPVPPNTNPVPPATAPVPPTTTVLENLTVVTLEGALWKDRSGSAPTQPERERPPQPKLTDAEKNEAALKKQLSLDTKERFEREVADWDRKMDEKAEELSKVFDKTAADIKKALRGKSNLVTERAHNLQNAKIWKFAKEVNAGRPAGTKLKAPALNEMLKKDGRYDDMTQEEQDGLLAEFLEHRGLKKSGTRLSNAAAARDVTAFTSRIDKELQLLQKRTGAIGFCVVARSDVHDTLRPACVGTEEARSFFTHILHTTDAQFAIKFDNFGVSKESAGGGLKFEFLRSQSIQMIGQGLERAAGAKANMKYADYDDILTDFGVELVGWPEGVEFLPPSVLGTVEKLRPLYDALVAGSCRWEKMMPSRVEEHKAAVASKSKTGKKERRDKGLTREEAREMREEEAKKKGKGKTGAGAKKKRSTMTPEELEDHLRTLNREKKRCQRARKAGKEVPAPSGKSSKSATAKKSRSTVSDSSEDDRDTDRDTDPDTDPDDNKDQGEDEWVPFTARKRKAADGEKESGGGKKRKVVNSGDESEEEGQGGGKKRRGKRKAAESDGSDDKEGGGGKQKTKKARLDHDSDDSDTSDSDVPSSPVRAPLPFSARRNPKLVWAEKMAKESRRDRKRKARALRKKQAAIQNALSPLKSPRSKGPRPIPKPAFKGAAGGTASHGGGTGPTFTPGASTSQLPKALSLTQIDGYQSGEESESGVAIHESFDCVCCVPPGATTVPYES
ncbi:hypothetical protein C8F04DRAFT_1199099 [Mycena alexandri]|uniref:Uncharacterized protein n=1 Tax=Mycena alexandri TaxID=1745969 RepID=A0AAD6RZR6_9AGAR|nr:hypothetical protein C8F04DRAFT_1199099 [Mycena alexandri]